MRVYTNEVQVELVGGPNDGEVVTVPWGRGLVRLVDALAHPKGHQYVWEVEDNGSRFLRYAGEVTA